LLDIRRRLEKADDAQMLPMMSLIRRLFPHRTPRPSTRLTQAEAEAIAAGVVPDWYKKLMTMASVAERDGRFVWQIRSATIGSGLIVVVDDATGDVIEQRGWVFVREARRPWGVGLALALILALANVAAGAARTDAIDLRAEEAAGGHTIAQHVGKSEAELRQRLARDPGISAASSFRNLEEAERFVAAALRDKESRIERWARFARVGEHLRLDDRADHVVGYGIPRTTGVWQPMSGGVVILKMTRFADRPYIVLTAYPEP
jgi:Bacterial CdiA-CT RNAse A domain